ncbi:glycosyltransferase [Streptosporangium sp. 'caverna']|uniref:glycosyltransferase n=1 Tax=Streptosporangium sp. 'caverna' TaxID=2202249 RepID=UPI000D7D5210|nr:glycosyltransferase [Streptosporangium sp. 'caverna']AWS41081.1 glycosyl transferase [Streptosporangium sp. 'caverna']
MTDEAVIDQPPIRNNDYSPLDPPALGEWDPSLSVSVIIPAYGGQHRLDLALAALAAQTYPDHLMEVIVVDDGSGPPLRLPEIAPAGARIEMADPAGWGTANAVNTGAALSEGRIIQRLDADMVVCREHIEALARWHHLADYLVTIGAKKFIEEPAISASQVHDGVRGGSLGAIFDLSNALASSTEQTIQRTNGLRASRNPYHVCTGPTVSMRRETFHAVGGVDPAVLRGEDTEFAYRLAQSGVVFIPDMAAEAVHLGLPAQRLDRERAVQVVAPYLAQRVPLRRDLRKDRGRRWLVPYVEVVLHVDAPGDQVRKAVNAALEGTAGDVIVTLVAPWSQLPEGRHPVIDDPFFDLRLLREHFSHDERVRLADTVASTPAPIPFRYTGPVSVPLGDDSLERMIGVMQGGDRPGMLVVDLAGDGTATLERTEALGRAKLLGADDVVTSIKATHGVRHGDRSEFWPVKTAPPAPVKEPVRKPAKDAPAQNAPSPTGASARSSAQKPAQARPESWLGRLRTRPRSG